MLMKCLSPKGKDPTRKMQARESPQCADCLRQPLRKQRLQSVTKEQAQSPVIEFRCYVFVCQQRGFVRRSLSSALST